MTHAGDDTRPATAVAGTPPTARAWPGRLAAVGAALAAGGLLLLAFPPYGWWWAAPLAVAALAVAVHRRGPLAGFGLGWLTGAALFVPLLHWTGFQVGWWPWLLLAGFEAGYLGLLGAAAAYASPLVDRYRWVWPPLTGALWVAEEALRDRAPFGGFPWGRLAFSQADAPTLRYAALGGAPLVTFAVAVAGGLLAACWLAMRAGRRGAPLAGLLAAAAVAVTAAGLAVPTAAARGAGLTVAIVQGNVPRLGLQFNAQRRAVLDNHVDGTLALAQRVAAGTSPRPDLVVWPENASDIDPLRNPDARQRIDQAATAIDAPILLGAVLDEPAGRVSNTGLLWVPGRGPIGRYVKQHPVPFAEYIPLRPLVRRITTKVDLVQRDFVAGHRAGVLTAPTAAGGVRIGDVICFEVAYDDLVRTAAADGARLLVVQTNNATFDAAEARQQLAMVRLRAVEHGRPALMASTVGVSGFVGADGRPAQTTGFDTPAVVVRHLTLGSTRTLATRLGAGPEIGLTVLAAVGLLAAGVTRRRGRPAAAPRRSTEEEV